MALSLHELESQAADCLPARHVLTLIGGRGSQLVPDPVSNLQSPELPDDAVQNVVPDDATSLLPNDLDLEAVANDSLDTVNENLPSDQTAGDALGAVETLVGGSESPVSGLGGLLG